MDLRLEHHPQGDATVLEMDGEVDLATSPYLRERVTSLLQQGQHHLVVDMTDVRFLDSTGLSALIDGRQDVQTYDGGFALVCTRPHILKIFRITGLAEVFAMYPSTAEAVQGVSPRALTPRRCLTAPTSTRSVTGTGLAGMPERPHSCERG